MPRSTRATDAASLSGGSDSDYEKKIQEAAAARARVKASRAKRTAKRKAVEAAYHEAVTEMNTRIQKAYDQYHSRLSSFHHARVGRLIAAIETRNAKQEGIATKLRDIQQQTYNLANQLRALYKGRGDEVSAALEKEVKGE